MTEVPRGFLQRVWVRLTPSEFVSLLAGREQGRRTGAMHVAGRDTFHRRNPPYLPSPRGEGTPTHDAHGTIAAPAAALPRSPVGEAGVSADRRTHSPRVS